MSFTNLKELIELAEKEETSIAEVMIKVEIEQGVTLEVVYLIKWLSN